MWGVQGFWGCGSPRGGVTVLLADIFDAVLGVLLEFGVAFDRPVTKTLDASLMNINNILPLRYFDRSCFVPWMRSYYNNTIAHGRLY